MPKGTYDDTHAKIIEKGRKMFLDNGYERTNLRDLCAAAGVTTGSFYRHFSGKEDLFSYLVSPAVDELHMLFETSEERCGELLDALGTEGLWKIMDADAVTDFIYRHFDRLKLLLKCADGTKYSDFLHDFVCLETEYTWKAFEMAKEKNMISEELPSDKELHMICHAYISGIMEVVAHDFKRSEAEKFIHTIFDFFRHGLTGILGLQAE